MAVAILRLKRARCLAISAVHWLLPVFGDHKPADVVVGVATLSPDYLIEVDAIAVIDHTTENYARISNRSIG